LQLADLDNMLSILMMSEEKCMMDFSPDGCCPKQVAEDNNTPITNNNFECVFIRLTII
jgi:hypothetical protein